MRREIKTHPLFERNFKRRISNKKGLVNKYKTAYLKFVLDPEHPDLKPHLLKGNLHGFKAFWVDDDCRVVYKEYDSFIILYDIGTHTQVYKKSAKPRL